MGSQLGLWRRCRRGCSGRLTRFGIIELDDENKYIINAGSVGQPRDGNAHAKYVIFDSLTNELTVRYIPYDVQDTIKKIYQVGLPEQHALRLMK